MRPIWFSVLEENQPRSSTDADELLSKATPVGQGLMGVALHVVHRATQLCNAVVTLRLAEVPFQSKHALSAIPESVPA